MSLSGSGPGLPDHIAVELEFCAYWAERDETALAEFRAALPVTWVAKVAQRVRDREPDGFYAAVLTLAERFLVLERH